jgi:hypothetical protein
VPLTKIELIRRIACLADNQKNTLVFVQIHIVGVTGSCGSGSKFIVASIKYFFVVSAYSAGNHFDLIVN